MKFLHADILAIGSELLHGGRVDSNSLFIADMLARCGIQVRKKMTLGDELTDIQAALRSSSRQADVVVVTGGLGSTVDDCTREAIATAYGRPLIVRRKALQNLTRQVHRRGRTVTTLLAKQALIPSGATVLANTVGTAPGFQLQEGKSLVFVLPGVPREAREMMEFQVLPILKRKLQPTTFLWTHTFNTIGLPETDIQQLLLPVLQKSPAIALSLLASTKGVKVTLSCWLPRRPSYRQSKGQSENNTVLNLFIMFKETNIYPMNVIPVTVSRHLSPFRHTRSCWRVSIRKIWAR